MTNEIIGGIAGALYESFGKGYEIYQNNVQQGLKEPCFFIGLLKLSVRPLLGRRRIRTVPFDICYFPKTAGDNREMQEAAEQMLEALEFIRLGDGGLLRGSKMSWEIVEDMLHFFVTYSLTENELPQQTPMESLKALVNKKDGR